MRAKAIGLIVVMFIAGCAATPGKVTQTKPVTPIDAPVALALDGYDPVAYFIIGKPVEGSPQYVHIWRGAKWQFSSEANRAAFINEPKRYAPQYGGYCAYATAHGFTARGDPNQWAIVNNKLYVNNNAFAMSLWDKNRPGHIDAGDVNWPLIPKFPLPTDGELSHAP
ncbi:MAG: YHS domain protein [Gammaproteobacteria bacterium]|nr:YHS domain protein [Gammaproteobacteria bacterium]